MHFRLLLREHFFWAALVVASVCGGCGVDNSGLQQPKPDAAVTDARLMPSSDAVYNDGTGGTPPVASGGVTGTAGAPGSGGARPGTGGTGTGGIPASGGAAQTGGRSGGAGGAPGTGGAGTGGIGGTPGHAGAGGMTSTGGRGGLGGGAGRPGAGGISPMGGTPGIGGSAGGGQTGCGPATCAHGCCDGNTCVTTQTRRACGTAGAACATCGACFQCGDSGTCELTRSSSWTVTCVGASVATTKTGGGNWDSGSAASAAPDPFCEFQINEIGQRDTDSVTDSFTPMWNQNITPRNMTLTANWLINQAGSWSILVGDYDGNNNEEICQIFPTLNAASFTTGTLTYSNQRSCQSLTVQLTCDE